MIQFAGIEELTDGIPSAVFARLSDAGWLARSLPDAEVIDAAADQASWRVKPKFAFMSGTLDTFAKVTRRAEPVVSYTIVSKGVGSSSTVVAELTIQTRESGLEILWKAEVTELGGLLKLVPRGLLHATAQKVIEDVWTAVKLKLAE